MIKKFTGTKGVKVLSEKELKNLKGGINLCCNPELECCVPPGGSAGICGTCHFCYSNNGICV